MSGVRRFCGTCGTDADDQGNATCSCAPPTELGRVVLGAVRLAGPASSKTGIARSLRIIARERDEQRRSAS